MNNDFVNAKPIFIGGCPRSGTTMLGSILGSAPGCVVTPESHFKQTIPAILGVDWDYGISRDDFFVSLTKNFRFKLWKTSFSKDNLPNVLKPMDYRRALLSLVDEYARAEGKRGWHFWIDHTPDNIKDPLTLMTIFPEAKFIHIVRDPRAVAASVLPLVWGPSSAKGAALFWVRMLSYGQELERVYPDKCFRVYYEDIVTSPEKTIGRVCEFCGIEFEDHMLTGSGFRLPGYTRKQHELVGSRPNLDRVHAWQKTLDVWQIAKIEKILGDLMGLMGYKKYTSGKLPKRSLAKRIAQETALFFSYLRKKAFSCKRKFYRWLQSL